MGLAERVMELGKKLFRIQNVDGSGPMAFDSSPGLYIHVPFCPEFCSFCPYNKIKYDSKLTNKYLTALKRESELQRVGQFSSIYIGGGTPSYDLDLLKGVVSHFREMTDGEIALEIHPADVSSKRLEEIRETGVNFVSLGIQSFDDFTLNSMGRRRQDSVVSLNSIAATTSAGFDFVDVDLIFDYQLERRRIVEDLETAISYGPEQVSVYPMMRFADTAYKNTKNDPEKELEILEELENVALSKGYIRDSLWTFKKRNEGRKYSSVSREFFLGIGTSASSFNGKEFRTNTFSLDEYYSFLDSGKLPVSKTIKMVKFSAILYYSFWALYGGQLDLRRLEEHFGRLPVRMRYLLHSAIARGYFQREEGIVKPTRIGTRKLHIVEEWLTYSFIDRIWSDLRNKARNHSASGESLV
ncbi:MULTISPECIES: radical SAM protein [Mesotoga]|jgi:oxygen-independent coproporphyrinogen-3 oxidase|uniref:radical SAM protein n=2 Tax=Kosmotogaceae TaxID=1643948 RepID=UPI002592FF20|nr:MULTISPECIES: radical SAM protein [Mesotoga]MCP5457618.1 radical SAM protein [Thermotogota bacterium]HOZ99763.1 radical SAM protein [Mesotoga prima]HQN61201.1 radical SAM protein [Mesotoga prima]HRX65833.1 radical SAM protein [Mesotoga sp.]HUM22769.1 radical SAM protein [Mesotoga prima]